MKLELLEGDDWADPNIGYLHNAHRRWEEWFRMETEYYQTCVEKYERAKSRGWRGFVGC